MGRRGWAGSLLALVLIAAAWFLVAPRALGGPVSYVVLFGTSMEPDLHAGDLVAVRESADYRVGDVVAYDNEDIGQIVLHRVIRRTGDRLVFKGDNNEFVDPYRPRPNELIGEMWFRVPGAGAVLKKLQTPLPAGLVAGMVGLIAMGGIGAGRTSNGGTQPVPEAQARRESRTSRGPLTPLTPRTLAAAFGVATLLSAILAAYVFTRPDTELTTARTSYEQVAGFSYSADAPAGPVYEDDLATGDPVFLNVLTEFDVTLSYRFETEAEPQIEGTGSIEARLRGLNGWHRTFEVAGSTPLSDTGEISGTVDLTEMQQAIEQVERITEVDAQSYELNLSAPLEIRGTVSGTELEETLEPKMSFTMDEQQLQLHQTPDAEAPPPGTPVVTSDKGTLTVATPQPARVRFAGRSIELDTARIAVLIVAGACLLGFALTGIPWLFAGRRDEPSRIRARYGSQMVAARTVDLSRARSMVEVDSIESLAGIAERFDLPILCHESPDVHRYIVESGTAAYVYACARNGNSSKKDARPQAVTDAGP